MSARPSRAFVPELLFSGGAVLRGPALVVRDGLVESDERN